MSLNQPDSLSSVQPAARRSRRKVTDSDSEAPRHKKPKLHDSLTAPHLSPPAALPPPLSASPAAAHQSISPPVDSNLASTQSSQPPQSSASSTAVRTSGQNYDPIRSAFENAAPAPAPPSSSSSTSSSSVNHSFSPSARDASPRVPFSASASPAIASIIDPPAPVLPPLMNTQMSYHQTSGHVAVTSVTSAASNSSLAPSPLPASPTNGVKTAQAHKPGPQPQLSTQSTPSSRSPLLPQFMAPLAEKRDAHMDTSADFVSELDVDSPKPASSLGKTHGAVKKEKGPSTAPSSNAPSPKPPKVTAKEQPLPQGSGLISNALFGVDDSTAGSGSSRTAPNIILHVPLRGTTNTIVNFARLAEEQYGFAALHPRLAAHRERLARVAAAGAALEKCEKGGSKGILAGESAEEDLSVDADRDSDGDGDILMGGSTIGATAGAMAGAPDGKKKRRRKKVEDYDRDDPFVDDSEMAWQEQAAASKDGFFVYSGPLVPEGEKVQVERADGTVKRGRGRVRGSGRGRGGATAAAATTSSSTASTTAAAAAPAGAASSTAQSQSTTAGTKAAPIAAAPHPAATTAAGGGAGTGAGAAAGQQGSTKATGAAASPTAAIPISQETGLPVRGPGSRGGGTGRRARGAKARQANAAASESAGDSHHKSRDGSTASSGRGSSGRANGASTPRAGVGGTGGRMYTSGPNGMVELAPAPTVPTTTPASTAGRPGLAHAPRGLT